MPRLSSRVGFLSSALLFVVVASILLVPACGNGTTTVSVEPGSISVTVGQQFTVQIWVKGVTGMEAYSFDIQWDANMMKRVSYSRNDNGRSHGSQGESGSSNVLYLDCYQISPPYTGDAYWVTVTFECLARGTSSIQMLSGSKWYNGNGWLYFDARVDSTVRQSAQTASTTRYVGGVVTPTSSFFVLAPYLTMIGLVAVAATVYVAKRRCSIP